MALQVLRKLIQPSDIQGGVASFLTCQSYQCKNSTPSTTVNRSALVNTEEIEHEERRRNALVVVNAPLDISKITGVPQEHIKGRTVRIYQFSKNSMQSGTNNVGVWQMDFDTRQRWENPLMGWSSTGDPLSNMRVQFENKKEAIEFAEKNGWKWCLEEDTPVKPKVKSYGFNFSWNKRNRVSTK